MKTRLIYLLVTATLALIAAGTSIAAIRTKRRTSLLCSVCCYIRLRDAPDADFLGEAVEESGSYEEFNFPDVQSIGGPCGRGLGVLGRDLKESAGVRCKTAREYRPAVRRYRTCEGRLYCAAAWHHAQSEPLMAFRLTPGGTNAVHYKSLAS